MLSRRFFAATLALGLVLMLLVTGCGAAATATPAATAAPPPAATAAPAPTAAAVATEVPAATEAPAPTAAPAATTAPANTPAAAAQDKPFAGTTLNILMEGVPDTEAVQQVLPKFEAETGIKVNVEVVQYAVMHEKLVPQLTSPEGSGSYDVLVVDNYWVGEFVSSNWIFPLDDRIKTAGIDMARYIPATIKTTGQVAGVTYMLPWYAYPMGLIYRDDIVSDPKFQADYKAKFGKDLDMAKLSLPEYVELAKWVTKDGFYGSSMEGQRVDPISMEWSNYLFSLGGAYYDETWKPVINSEAGVKATELYIDAIKHAAPPGAEGFNLEDTTNVMNQGKAFSMVSFANMMTWMNDPEQSQVAGKIKMTVMPGGHGLMGGWGWAIPRSSAHPDAAWELIRWMEEPQVALERGMLGSVPTQESVYADAGYQAKFPLSPVVHDLISLDLSVPLISRSPQMIEVVGTNLSEAVAGTKTAKQAMDDAAKGLEQVAKDSGLLK